MARRQAPAASNKCNCNFGWALIALILFTIGLYGVAGGFIGQLGGAAWSMVLPWYFIGLLLVMLAKMAKWKAHGTCRVHSMK